MSETVTAKMKLDMPSKRTIWRKLRNIIWTIGIIAVSFAGFVLWIEYRKFRQTEFLVDIKNAGARVHSRPAPYPWMLPFLTNQTRPFIEFVSPLEYDAAFVDDRANREAIKKTLTLPNLVALHLFSIRPVDHELVVAIAQTTSLRALTLSGSTISDSDLDLISGMPHLEELDVRGVALSETGLASLLKMNQLKVLSLGDNQLDLFQGFTFEATADKESKSIKVGDLVTFTGTFQSAKFIPTTVNVGCYVWTNGHKFFFNVVGTVTQSANGTYRFVLKAPTKIEYAGPHKIYLTFVAAGPPRITLFQTMKDLIVIDPAQPQPKVPQSVVPMKIEGKVDIKEGTPPK